MVRKGTTFFSEYADSRPKWKVIAARGRGTWDCQVISEDWKGCTKVFGTEEIERSQRFEAAFKNIDRTSKAWWSQRSVGEIVHYHNGFGQYVRGVVVRDGKEMKMRGIALVGEWAAHDLPMRGADGQVRISYTVRKIREGEVWQPGDSMMFESPDFSAPMGPKRSFDPTNAPPLDISDPAPLKGEAAIQAEYENLRMRLSGILGAGYRDPKRALTEAAEMIAAVGIRV